MTPTRMNAHWELYGLAQGNSGLHGILASPFTGYYLSTMPVFFDFEDLKILKVLESRQ